MDEVDGMSAGDRGGVVALKALIKKTQVCWTSSRDVGPDLPTDTHYLHCKRWTGAKAETTDWHCGQCSFYQVCLGLMYPHFANPGRNRPAAAHIKSRIASICYKYVVTSLHEAL